MKRRGILNVGLSQVIAEMGHTDMLAVCDAGLPIPFSSNRIDLAVISGRPRFMEVLRPILAELEVERAILAEEVRHHNPEILQDIVAQLEGLPVDFISHEEFKALLPRTKGIVRTGECTPYSNIILVSGVKGIFAQPD